MTEQWLPIPGWEGHYEASSLGRVRGLDRILQSNGGTGERLWKGRILLQQQNPLGYFHLELSRDGKAYTFMAHRLVCLAFHGLPEPGQEVRHLDGVSSNNRSDNLAWGTHQENMLDKVAHGTHPMSNRTHCPSGHEYSGSNLFISSEGTRRCRTCERAHGAAQRRAKGMSVKKKTLVSTEVM